MKTFLSRAIHGAIHGAVHAAGIAFILFSGCAGEPEARSRLPFQGDAQIPEQEEPAWIITNYRNAPPEGAGERAGEKNGNIPSWVVSYFEAGNAGVEALEEFQDRYVFVADNPGNNFYALEQWMAGFSPDLDFARLAAARIENRLLAGLTQYPDDEYGSYFEALIRSASDMQWEGAVREDDFWVRRRFVEKNAETGEETSEESGGREIYDFLILVTVEKSILRSQIDTLLKNIKPNPPLTKDQSSAVNRIGERFYEGF